MNHSLFFSGLEVIGKVLNGFLMNHGKFLSPNESVKIFKTTNKLIFLILFAIFTTGCNQAGKVDKTEANNNLLYGLVIGQNQVKNSMISINGNWKVYTCSNGNCITTGDPYAYVYISTDPSTGIVSFYQENHPTCFGVGNSACTTNYGEKINFFFPADRSIESFSNSDKNFLFKNIRSNPATYDHFLWDDLENEIYSCETFKGSSSIDSAKNILNQEVSSGNISRDKTKLKTTGCNSFGWNLMKRR